MNNIKEKVKEFITIDEEQGFIITGQDNLKMLKLLPDGCVDAIYIDPPYLTNKTWEKAGFSFEDKFDSMWDYLFFLGERLVEAKRLMRERIFTVRDGVLYVDGEINIYKPLEEYILKNHSTKTGQKKLEKGLKIGGSIFVHVDYRTNNEIKTYLMDPLFGEGRTTLTLDEVGMLMQSKIGKQLHTPVSVPAVEILSGPSICMDFFAGSLSYPKVAKKLGRRFIGIELNKTEALWLS